MYMFEKGGGGGPHERPSPYDITKCASNYNSQQWDLQIKRFLAKCYLTLIVPHVEMKKTIVELHYVNLIIGCSVRLQYGQLETSPSKIS